VAFSGRGLFYGFYGVDFWDEAGEEGFYAGLEGV